MASTEKDAATVGFAKTLSNVPWCDDYEKMVSGVLYVLPHPSSAALIHESGNEL